MLTYLSSKASWFRFTAVLTILLGVVFLFVQSLKQIRLQFSALNFFDYFGSLRWDFYFFYNEMGIFGILCANTAAGALVFSVLFLLSRVLRRFLK